MELYFIIKTLHVLSATVLFGTGAGIAYFMFRGQASGVPAARRFAASTTVRADLLFTLPAVRMAMTPGATKARRVRRRATELFRIGAESRTRAATGVLLYLSLAERRAEIVAERGIHARVAPEEWGQAMAALVRELRAGRPGEGMAAAVERIGAVLAEHFPRSADDTNELPDRLVEL